MMSVLDQVRCTVLNASYEPLAVVSSKRGLILVIEGKAHIAAEHPEFTVNSAKDIWPVPTQIVLKEFVKSRPTHRVPAILTQRNLFLRDGYRCGYCARHKQDLKSHEFLTRDHIHPQSKGGKDEWKNVVTACSTCNNKKADMRLEDTGMELRKVPTVPTIFELWARAGSKARKNGII
jgi:5-methylcytosine-specific restriction endonuclease McrA